MELNFFVNKKITSHTFKKCLFISLIAIASITSTRAQLAATALSFDGINDLVSVPASPSLNISSALTIESWINISRTSGVQDVICKSSYNISNGYIFPRTSDGWRTLEFLVNINGNGWQTLAVNYGIDKKNQWHHVAATYDGYTMRIFIDGVLAGEKGIPGSITVNNNPLSIGGQDGYEDEYFEGKIDEARIWNRSLSQCEITSHMNCELAGSQSGLAAYYKFNQGLLNVANLSTNRLTDASGNNNTGTLQNFDLLNTISNWTSGTVSSTVCTLFTPVIATAAAAQPSVAVGGTISLTATGGDTYAWSGPNGFTSITQNPSITAVGTNASGTYTVLVTKNGCTAAASVVVNVAPRAGALNLDGADNYIIIPNSPSFNSTKLISIESWVNPASPTPLVQNVVSKSTNTMSNGFIFPRTDDGWQSFSFWLAINGEWKVVSATFPGLNKWSHVAATYDGFFMRIYLNGAVVGSLEAPGTITTNNNDVSIGQQEGKLEFFKGSMDELRIWNRSLTQCEIQNNMNCELNGANNALASQNGLGAYYRFNQGLVNVDNTTVTTLIDSSGHANNGTLHSFDLLSTASNWIAGKATGTCANFVATAATASSNGPVLEVGSTIQLSASAGNSWSWTGPNGFTSTQQNPFIPNAGTERSGNYNVTVTTGSGCTVTAATKVTVTYKAGTLDFDGMNDYVKVPASTSLNIPNTITLESWVFPTNGSRLVQDVMCKSSQGVNNGYIFPRTDDGWKSFVFYLHINGDWQKLSANFPSLNEWHHLAATYDGYFMRIYLDGVLKASKEMAGSIAQNDNDLLLGQQTGFTEYFKGKLEGSRIWNRALNQCEIINNMNCELDPSVKNGLVAYYKYNQGFLGADNTGITNLVDASDNANNGTLQNFALDGLTSNWSQFKTNGTCSILSLPPVTATSNGTIFGIGSAIKLFASGGSTYTWDGPDSFVSTAQNPTIPNAQVIASGTYTVTAPFVNCVVTASTRLNVSPLSPIVASGPTTFCPSSSVTLSTVNTGTAYQWYRNDVAISGATANNFVASLAGDYAVSVTNGRDVLVSVPITITVTDNLAPQPDLSSLPAIQLETPAIITTFPTAMDNCRGVVVATTVNPVSYTQPGTFTITWIYDDRNGNTSRQDQKIVVVDRTPPVLSLPANLSVNASPGACNAVVNYVATATDNTGSPVVITYSQNPGTSFSTGTTLVTITGTDVNGNVATGTFNVTVIDNQDPTITAPPAVTRSINSDCSALNVILGTPVTADNCAVASVTNDHPSSTYPIGSTTVTWTVTDASGRTATATQVVTVTDNIWPTITAPANLMVNANAGCTATGVQLGTPVATDNCSFTVTNNHPSSTFPIGVTTVTWTVTDGSGHVMTATQLVTVTDNTDPVISAPGNITVNTNAGCTATGVAIGTAIATDNCSTVSITNNHPSTTFLIGTTTVTWTATDGSGRTATANQLVTVIDNINPTITAPANVTVALTESVGCAATGVNIGTPTTLDNCTVASVTNDHPSTTYPVGKTTVTWTVTDAAGHTATATQLVSVLDNDNPTIIAPEPVTVFTNAGCTASNVSLGTPVASDNCSVASVSNNHPSATYPVGTTTVTWTVTDASGRTAAATQTVTVVDNIDPTISTPATVTVNANAGCSATGVSLTAPNASDNCTVKSLTNDHPSTSYPIGTTTVTWTVTDASGRTATATQNVIVVDNIDPAISTPASVTVNANTGCNATGVTLTAPTASDNCTVKSLTNDHPSTTYPVGTTIVTWTVTDASGHTATATQNVTVVDNIDPTISTPAAVTVNANGGCNATGVTLTAPNASDNCTVKSLTNDHPSTTYPVGTTTVIWTATDASGRTATATQTVTVQAAEIDIVGNGVSIAKGDITPVASDNTNFGGTLPGTPITKTFTIANTGKASLLISDISISGTNAGDFVKNGITLPATVAANSSINFSITFNASSAGNKSATVLISNNDCDEASYDFAISALISCSAPVFAAGSDISVTAAATQCSAQATYTVIASGTPAATYTYSFSGATTGNGSGTGSGSPFNVGRTAVTVTATNSCGAVSSSFAVNVLDKTNPVITIPANVSINCGASVLPTSTGNATGTDNCSNVIISFEDVVSGNKINRTWKATDASGNSATGVQVITLNTGTVSITSIPTASTYTGGIATSLYLGYGAQSTSLQVAAQAPTGSPYTYTWSGNTSLLSSTTSVSPVFTPTQAGSYTFNVTSINKSGCASTGSITICVTDIRVPGQATASRDDVSNTENMKVYLCHVPPGNPGNRNTLSISINAVAAHLANHPGDRLGSCDQAACTGFIDNVKPEITCPADITVNCSSSIAPSATGTATATDNSGAVTVSYNDVTSGNVITRTWKAIDPSGNYTTAVQKITVGAAFSTTILSVPAGNTYTGGASTNLYLGYGAQSTLLQVGTLPATGAPYTYTWIGNNNNRLNSTNSSAPVFTPAVSGYYAFSVLITNKYGCTYTAGINICVTDIRVPGSNGTKIYVTHTPKNGTSQSQSLQVPVGQVTSHISYSPVCGGDGTDRLGSVEQTPCQAIAAETTTGQGSQGVTKEISTVAKSAVEVELKVTVMPNPSTTYFTLKLESKYETPVSLRVMDANGRMVDARSKLGANSTLQVGHNYISGTYYAELIQGNSRQVIQLIKIRG